MNDDLQKRVGLCLFFCRLGVFLVFAIWTYDKLVRPEHGIHMMNKFYYVPGVAEAAIIAFSLFELVMCILFVCGFYKRFTRGFFLFLSVLAISVPEVLKGYVKAIMVEAHPTILYFTGFCLFACAFAVYYLRDYDTRFSLAKSDRALWDK